MRLSVVLEGRYIGYEFQVEIRARRAFKNQNYP
jgi:hypothetical protein